MLITSKSIYHSNLVIVFDSNKFLMPDNAMLATLYQGEQAMGARFADDSILKTKIFDFPKLKIQVGVEPKRLRVEDLSQNEPKESNLIKEALYVYEKLFSPFPIIGFGFNFDIYYRFSDVIQMNDLFKNFVNAKILEKSDLRDLGIQFTLDKKGGKKQGVYFIKITAPLEIAVHITQHYNENKLPKEKELKELFEKSYEESDDVIQNLKF